MKTKCFITTLFMMVVGLQTASTQGVMKIWHDGEYDTFSISSIDSVQFDNVKLVTRIVLSPNELNLTLGSNAELMATALPVSADKRDVAWESSNPNVAAITGTERKIRVSAVGVGSAIVKAMAMDGSGICAECQVNVFKSYEYVDLGLPSGTLWATCNVGASQAEEFGDYFAWGETEPKEEYTWGTYKWMNEGQSDSTQINKYTFDDGMTDASWYNDGVFIGDGLTELLSEDDAATANWGNEWQMPSMAQWEELLFGNYTSTIWTTQNDVSGLLVTSHNNEMSIFLPASGYQIQDFNHIETYGDYWSRSIDVNKNSATAYYRYFKSDGFGTTEYNRYVGRNVRPVRKQ